MNFKTNLTTLKYGMDRPGGGDSGQPFIQSPIETVETAPSVRNLYEANRTSLDFPIRGGSLTSLANGTYVANSALIDRERIQKFIESAPRGIAFVQKQTGLQLTNPKTQVPNSLNFAGVSIGNAVLPVTQVYNPLNTLAQVAVQGTGAHFNRHGVVPTIYESPQQTYAYIVGAPDNNTEFTNRLAILRALKLIGNTGFNLSRNVSTGLGIDPLLVERLGVSMLQGQLFNYSGGPGSVYGIGNTRINRTTNTDAANATPTVGFTNQGVNTAYSAVGFTYEQIAQQNTRTTNPTAPTRARIQDFRESLPAGTTPRVNYTLFNIANPGGLGGIGVGNPGSILTSTNYTSSKATGIDLLNQNPLFYYNYAAEDPWTAGGNNTKDIIKFTFECLSNDGDEANPNSNIASAIVLRAFLDGQIADTNTAEYNPFKYLGRGETFRTYQGFTRSISFTFKMFAQSRAELKPLYTKLNHLISQVYPDYSPKYNLMRGSVVKLTIGDYIYRMPGFLENVNVTIDNSNTPWEIVLGGTQESDVAQLPHMVTVACTFAPIMDILPRRENLDNPYVPLIANTPKQFLGGYEKKFTTPTAATPATTAATTQANVNANPIQTPLPLLTDAQLQARRAAADPTNVKWGELFGNKKI